MGNNFGICRCGSKCISKYRTTFGCIQFNRSNMVNWCIRRFLGKLICYWYKSFPCFIQFLLPKDRQTLDLVSLNQHAFLAIICLVDLLITNSRIRIKDLIPAWLFATAYAINTILVWLIFGKFV